MAISELAKTFMPAHENNYQVGRSGYKICKITPHHMAGVLSAERCGELFQDPKRKASANYGIGDDGTIICYVDEDNRAYTSANRVNDCQAITIEVSNCMTGGEWPISAAAWESLINLCVDICTRYEFRLEYDETPNGSLTRHNMFAKTACPGPYLQGKFPELVAAVNARLDEAQVVPEPEPTDTSSYLVKVTVEVLNIRADAGTEYKITGQIKDGGMYTIVAEKDGNGASKWGKLKSGAGWIALDYTERITSGTAPQEPEVEVESAPEIRKGIKVMFTGTKSYSGIKLADWTNGAIFDVLEISGDRVVIGKGTAVTAAVNIKDCRPV